MGALHRFRMRGHLWFGSLDWLEGDDVLVIAGTKLSDEFPTHYIPTMVRILCAPGFPSIGNEDGEMRKLTRVEDYDFRRFEHLQVDWR